MTVLRVLRELAGEVVLGRDFEGDWMGVASFVYI